jgi:hypothetical protein
MENKVTCPHHLTRTKQEALSRCKHIPAHRGCFYVIDVKPYTSA